jgi:hypothetical protein
MKDKDIFFLVGAAKAGTSTVYDYLNQVNNITMSEPKETHFFDYEHKRSVNEDEYHKYFISNKDTNYFGEATPSYLFVPHVPRVLYENFPKAKIVIILRDPVKRAFSNWWMFYSRGLEQLSFKEAIQNDIKCIEEGYYSDSDIGIHRWKEHVNLIYNYNKVVNEPYLAGGIYIEQIKRYLKYYPKNQVKIMLFEDLKDNPQKFMEEISDFLEIAIDPELLDYKIVNEATTTNMSKIFSIIGPKNMKILSNVLSQNTKEKLKKIINKNSNRPKISYEDEKFLKEFYKQYNDKLECFLNRDLKGWK